MDAVALARLESCRLFAEFLCSLKPGGFRKLKDGDVGWFCLLWWGSEVSHGTVGGHSVQKSNPRNWGSRAGGKGHRNVAVTPAPLGVKGAQATFSRFLGTGSLHWTPACLPALIAWSDCP